MKTRKTSVAFLDLEAKRGPEEVGGWENVREMGLAVAVTLLMPRGELRIFEEEEVEDMVKMLNSVDCVVGFNCHIFHFKILRGFVGRRLRLKSSLDLLKEFVKAAGHRIPLHSLVSSTLGQERADHSTPVTAKRTKTKVIQSLCQNVLDLERLHRRIKKSGRLFFLDRFGNRKSVKLGGNQ